MWVAAYKHTPISILKKLALDDDLRVRSIVSLQPNFSNEWLISNKVSTESILVSVNSLLSSLQYDYSQKNIKTKFAVLKLLCSNKDSDLRLQAIDILIDDYSCPSDLLESLAKYRDVNIRNKVAGHIKTPIHVKEQLANDRSLMVRKTLASCSYTPKHILRRLASDNQDEVRNAVIFNDPFDRTEKPDRCINGILEKILENSWILSALNIEYENLDDDSKQKILIKVAEDRTAKTQEYRTLLSEAKDTPNYILEKLVTSPEIRIRYNLAKRKDLRLDLSDRLWEELINDPNQDSISERSQEHLNCNFIRVNLSHKSDALPFILEKYYISSSDFARFIILSHPLVPYFYAKKATLSSSWLERYALTQSPKLPDEIREILSQDTNKIVRAAARYQDKIFAPSSGDIIPKLKTSDCNLVSTLNVLTKELHGLVNHPEHWEKRTNFEVIFWENQKQFSFIDCLSELKILQQITISELLKSPQEQTTGKYVKLP